MAVESTDDESLAAACDESRPEKVARNAKDNAPQASDDDEDDDEADEEPKLKYSRLTTNLGPVYRNGDATSAFLVAGDKMIVGTHNGNIHALNIPSFQPLRTYNAHPAASVTSLSVSPLLPSQPFFQTPTPPKSADRLDTTARQNASPAGRGTPPRAQRQAQVPPTPANQIYIASSSIDGHVCVSSLIDPKDVTLRNFGRPVQAVALSPDYKADRSYLSGGLAGELILTTGGQLGVRSNANTSSASQTAQGWLGAIGLGGHGGKDTVLHSGEGAISAIKWSLSGKYVAWSNEHGIRIMRTNLYLDGADSDSAWKRIGFIDKPNRRIWQDMAGVWKARMEWVDDQSLESDDDAIMSMNGRHSAGKSESTLPHHRVHEPVKATKTKKTEKLVIGWGDAAWIVHVQPGGAGVGRDVGERSVGSAEIIHFLRFDDCVVSGISLYTPSLLLVLAYRTHDDDNNPVASAETTPRRGMNRRANGLSPELKLIDAATSDEIEVDSLTVSRYETLSAADYHLGTLYVPHPKTMTLAQKSALEAIGGGIWDVGAGAARVFSSGASVFNMPFSSEPRPLSRAPSMSSASAGGNSGSSAPAKRQPQIHQNAATAGLKVFIHSPYDCVLAIKRELSDHFNWELEHENYKDAWELLEDHPEIITSPSQLPSESSPIDSPLKKKGSLQDFFADESDSQTTLSATRTNLNSAVEKEKRRIGDLWVQQLVSSDDWKQAGKIAGRVLGTSSRWEHWVWKFAQTNHFNEISPYVPAKPMQPPLPSMVYEVVLGHYIINDRIRFKHLLEDWDPELYDINSVIEAIKSKLSAGDVTEESIEKNVQGRDWRILQDGLAKLFLASGRQREALRCYIRLQNADAAMSLIRDFHLVEAVRDDIPGFILMRVSKEQMESAPLSELEETSTEAIGVLVEEGCRGTIPTEDVVNQLQKRGPTFQPFLFFYLRRLWKPEMHERTGKTAKERVAEDRLAADGKIVAEAFADLMVELFAEYDRPLLMEYLRKSQSFDLNKATAICERREYIPELVHILSKTGQTKRALYLIIEKLSDVSFAISFAKEQDDPDLWNDLLEYSMDKPHFIRGLLEEVGTAIDPIKLVRRIPEGLEIEGLRDGIGRMVREYEIQHSISEGVARVLRGEVAAGMDTLRAGQKRGVKFEVEACDDELEAHKGHTHTGPGKRIDIEPKGVDPKTAAKVQNDNDTTAALSTNNAPVPDPPAPEAPEAEAPPGHCTGCRRPFMLPTAEEEDIIDGPLPPSRDTLVGFACGHVFHLSCLLPKTSASASVATTLQQQLANDAMDSGGRWSRSVGAKVAHAHVIKSAVGRGCVVCRERDEMLGED
ncbi:vacuolar assembly protein-like protein [Dothidotthia symphoricarpi CBS 119687]|uniref:Vacuolar assembly protein-like protein n=1 Tax=Dothidotthia symphoricarpi CBS 119687 TaxID=1392245 RepID=A0A6A6AG90_9PLEO|nr:vacuolar assembly protein-like protein [Dothidotthia symphoricarpi CBS 119687]KAF2130135.1 vacuolar assembly protein-like protein [Dothidotthia symphoricarpi CBS 119687]